VDEEHGYAVTGNACPRGEKYGEKELKNPTRTLTSTVCIAGAALPRLPVKTDAEIPKADVMRAVRLLDGLCIQAPVRVGDVLLRDILGTGVNFVATRSMGAAGPV
jgi:CxxC motif-containing protein